MFSPAGQLALDMIMGGDTLLDLAREVSEAVRASGAEGGVVGGIAVFLHGYERTTTDIDVFTYNRPRLAEELAARGFEWDEAERQFEKLGVPVQMLAPSDELGFDPTRFEERRAVRVVSLGDLISMKLASGTEHVHRARDLADIIDLAQAVPFDKSITGRVTPRLRPAFRKLMDALRRDPPRRPRNDSRG